MPSLPDAIPEPSPNPTAGQHWNPSQYAQNARYVADLGMPVLELLAPTPGESILDLGCGDGVLTLTLQDMGCHVTGVDASAEMIAAAQALGVAAEVMNGEALTFSPETFDAVFTNAALHWIKQPEAVIAGVHRVLKPNGRFVGEFGGQGNVATIVDAITTALAAKDIQVDSPWFFPAPETYGKLLQVGGFSVETMDLIPRPTLLPGDVGGWLETFAQPYTAALPREERTLFIANLVETLRPALCDDHGQWTADYVRLRFSATKE